VWLVKKEKEKEEAQSWKSAGDFFIASAKKNQPIKTSIQSGNCNFSLIKAEIQTTGH
jgi:hypothetical protein